MVDKFKAPVEADAEVDNDGDERLDNKLLALFVIDTKKNETSSDRSRFSKTQVRT